MFYLRTLQLSLQTHPQKTCPTRFSPILLARKNECNNVNCDFIYPKKSSELKCETILANANHFTKKDIDWFNEYHFTKMPNITNKIKKLLGNAKGPNSKTS